MGVAEAAEAVARRSYGKLVAVLSARTRDVASAEDALSDAFATALARWPVDGVPRSPEGWLLTVARRKLTDAARKRATEDHVAMTMASLADEMAYEADDARAIPDERLRLMFACAHPAIDAGVRAPLILQTVLGFDAARIASAFLIAPATMGQRLVRAKNRIRNAGISFRIPDRDELPERLGAVLEAIYAVFTEGWAEPSGTQVRSRGFVGEALWLARLLVTLLPNEPEALGLLALMLHADARREARRDEHGEFVSLDRQDPARWNAAYIAEAETLLLTASRLRRLARFQLEAAVQSAHNARRRTGRTDWAAIVQLYDGLFAHTNSIVVAVNRAVALAELRGSDVGVAALDALESDNRLADYQPYWAARAALLVRAGRRPEAARAYQRAIGLETDAAVRGWLQAQLAAVAEPRN